MITQSQVVYVSGVSLASLVALAYLNRKQPPPSEPRLKFTNENITQRFTAALPEICPVLNLELAVCNQVETFTQTDELRTLWGLINLGTNVVQISVPVSYRFHICVRDAWKLETAGNRVIVHAPGLRPALPPAIDTHGLQRLEQRGWCRWSPTELMAELERQITPTLIRYAHDPRRLQLVRDTSRESVAEFVKLWLEREGQWGKHGFTQIQVKFADEAKLPPTSTLKLLS
jgi:hypothetical protein